MASVRVHVYVDKAECVCFRVTRTQSLSGQPASLPYRCCCFAEFCIVSNHVPSGLYLWRRQSLWLRSQFQSCKCLSENITKRLPAWRQLGTLMYGLTSFLVAPLSPRSSPLNTAGTPLELALPAAALWWALSPCMSANIHTHARARNSQPSLQDHSSQLSSSVALLQFHLIQCAGSWCNNNI